MPLSLLIHSALALFAQRTRIPTSARSIGFCAIWVCISSSSTTHSQAASKDQTDQKSSPVFLPPLFIHFTIFGSFYPTTKNDLSMCTTLQ